MGFFGNKKKKSKNEDEQDEVRGGSPEKSSKNSKADTQNEKLRLKKIRAMKKKFDETVWETALDTMRSSIPQFTIIEPDPDIPGGEIPKYVLLGFDTKIVDNFSNKADDDVGSIMSAIKHSMDVVIEDPLFDNELILVIPTPKSLAALAEFEETFDLKFLIVYASEEHVYSIETKSAEEDESFIYITLEEVRTMLKDSVPVKEVIHGLQIRVGSDGDYGGLTGNETTESRAAGAGSDTPPPAPPAGSGSGGDDDAISEEEYDKSYGEGDSTGSAPPAAPPEKDVAGAVSSAVAKAGKPGRQVEEMADDAAGAATSAAAAPVQPPPPAAPAPAPAPPAATAGQTRAASSAQQRIQRLKAAAQAASDQAKADPEIQNRQQAMAAPQRQQFDMSAMDQYVVRKYYSDELGLEVSSEPFDAMFLQSNPYVPFQEVDSDNWLDGYVNNLRRDANARLAKLHYENLMLMRTRFLSIVTEHCAEITKSVATDDPSSRFGFAAANLKKMKEDALAGIPAQAEAYKKENEEAYQTRMRTEMENAANVARANFINRYGKEHERELREIETDLRNALESEFVARLEELHDERRAEAKRQLDLGISEALRLCKDEYTKMIANERMEYARLQAVIVDYMNEHMANDEARTAVEAENARRNDTIARITSEHAADIARAKADFEARVAEIRAEADKSAMAHETAMPELKDRQAHAVAELQGSFAETVAHKDSEIAMLQDQLEQADKRMGELSQTIVNLDAEAEKKYATQLAMVRSERDAWDERAHHLERLHKYTDKLKLTSVAILLAAALAIGIICGCVIMSGEAQKAVDRYAEQIQAEQVEQAPEVHYFVNGEEVDVDGMAGQDAGTEGGADDGR